MHLIIFLIQDCGLTRGADLIYFLRPKMNTLSSIFGMGVAFSLAAFTLSSRADTIIDNLGNTSNGSFNSGTAPVGTVFTMSDTSGEISSLTLKLHNQSGSQAGTVYLFDTSGSGISALPAGSASSGIQIGTFSDATAGDSLVSITLAGTQPTLLANTSYAIVLEGYTANIEWDYSASSANAGDGTPGRLAYNTGGTSWRSDTVLYGLMNLEVTPAPEVSATTLAGFGAITIIGGQMLRRKRSAKTA